jgi:hypothetical protein
MTKCVCRTTHRQQVLPFTEPTAITSVSSTVLTLLVIPAIYSLYKEREVSA